MRTVPVILGVMLLTSAGATAAPIGCGFSSPIAVASSLVVVCGDDTFDFGHDLQGNPANPLPLGGSVTLKSIDSFAIGFGYFEWDLNFGFPNPSIRMTEVDFSIFGDNPGGSAAEFFALGRSPSPFGTRPPNDKHDTPNESGSDFLITETVTDLVGSRGTLSICGGNNFPPCDGSIVNQPLGGGGGPALRVVTKITDNAGDLTGFDEGFQTPEPGSWMLLAGGLLSLWALRRSPK